MFYAGLVIMGLYIFSTYYSHKLHIFDERLQVIKVLSFINGFLFTALILKFLQRFYTPVDTPYLYLLVIGITFTLFYSFSKNAVESDKAKKKFINLRTVYLYIHSIVVGVLFAKMAQSFSLQEIILFGLPILLLKTGATYYKSYNTKTAPSNSWKDYIIDALIVFTYIVSFQFLIPDSVFMLGLSFVTGTLMFVIVNMIVTNKNICMSSVMSGTLFYSLLYILPSLL